MEIILEVENIFIVPKAPDFIWGVINHRGRIITIVDLSLLMGLHKGELDKTSRIIVIDSAVIEVGLLVSNIYDFHAIVPDQLKEVPGQSGSEKEDRFVQKLLEYNSSVVSVVDKKRLESYLYELTL